MKVFGMQPEGQPDANATGFTDTQGVLWLAALSIGSTSVGKLRTTPPKRNVNCISTPPMCIRHSKVTTAITFWLVVFLRDIYLLSSTKEYN